MSKELFSIILEFINSNMLNQRYLQKDLVAIDFLLYIESVVDGYAIKFVDQKNKRITFVNRNINNELICEYSDSITVAGVKDRKFTFRQTKPYASIMNCDFIGPTKITFDVNENYEPLNRRPLVSFDSRRIRKINGGFVVESIISSGSLQSLYNVRVYSNELISKFDDRYLKTHKKADLIYDFYDNGETIFESLFSGYNNGETVKPNYSEYITCQMNPSTRMFDMKEAYSRNIYSIKGATALSCIFEYIHNMDSKIVPLDVETKATK